MYWIARNASLRWSRGVPSRKTKEKRESYCIQRAAFFVADFVYVETATGRQVVVDVKSPITRKNAEYRLKKKMMLAFNGIEVTEI